MDGSRYAHSSDKPYVVVVGAGIAGLAATLRLAVAGLRVTLLERHSRVGGKIRNLPSRGGPVAAGPTVLTMRHVFDELFEQAGTQLDDCLRLIPQKTIARHVWPDGSQLDLMQDHAASLANVETFAGPKAAHEFDHFCRRARRLFEAFDAPMMQEPKPDITALSLHVMRHPGLIPAMAPLSTLRDMLRSSFSDPRLRQLFGRYATYVGGAPSHVPAILSLIWQAEAAGVWVVRNGIFALASAIAELAATHGAAIECDTHIEDIDHDGRTASGVTLSSGRYIPCDAVLFAGDPRALAVGALGPKVAPAFKARDFAQRSFSARVHSFAAHPEGLPLAHHNVLFDNDPDAEFRDLIAGRLPRNPSFYICAMDRGLPEAPPDQERFEIITNAPASTDDAQPGDLSTWHETIIQKMARFGITFNPIPDLATLTTEQDFAAMFPESQGALYGQSPHGLTASLKRPTARTRLKGLYLAGGGCHPGAGVPMATLSARHAAEAILSDLTSASRLPPTATHGGTSMA